jgi:hypothetical protein
MPPFARPVLTASLLLSLTPWLVQCDSRPKSADHSEKSARKSRPTTPPAVAVPVEVRADGLAYRPGEPTPFTGEAVELHPDVTPGAVMRRIPYVDGKKHGSVTRWTPKGKILEDRKYEHGAPKSCVNYHSNGQKKIEVILNAKDKAEGPYFRWHDNGVLQVESRQVHGNHLRNTRRKGTPPRPLGRPRSRPKSPKGTTCHQHGTTASRHPSRPTLRGPYGAHGAHGSLQAPRMDGRNRTDRTSLSLGSLGSLKVPSSPLAEGQKKAAR